MKTLDKVIKAYKCCNHDDGCEDCPYASSGIMCCSEKHADALHYLKEYQDCMKTWAERFSGIPSAEPKICNLVDIDDVLDLFDCSDEDIYAKSVIEDALYDGTLRKWNTVMK